MTLERSRLITEPDSARMLAAYTHVTCDGGILNGTSPTGRTWMS